jgi:hypothetical protein
MRLLLALAALVLATVSGISAEAQQPSIDPEALAKAKVLVDKLGMTALTRQMYDSQVKSVMRVLELANPGKADEVAKVMPLFREEFDKRMPAFLDAIAAIYALHFSAAELAEIESFYESAVGKKLIAALPTIVAEAQALGAAFGKKLSEDVVRTLRPELEKRNLKLEPQKT